jgi:hypothetical protein
MLKFSAQHFVFNLIPETYGTNENFSHKHGFSFVKFCDTEILVKFGRNPAQKAKIVKTFR